MIEHYIDPHEAYRLEAERVKDAAQELRSLQRRAEYLGGYILERNKRLRELWAAAGYSHDNPPPEDI